MNKRTFLKFSMVSLGFLPLVGCNSKDAESVKPAEKQTVALSPITLGTMAGPHAEIADEAAKVAATLGLQVKVVEFSDYVHVNEALASKDIDANAFQHVPFLKKSMESKGYDFTPLGKTVIFPIGLYSDKIHNISEIKDGMLVTIPTDPANSGRALKLLEKHGLIKLKTNADVTATVSDIVENPKHLVFKELDSALLGRSLPDAGFAAINGSWAVKSGLSPAKDAFILEDGSSDFANVVVVRTDQKDRPEFKVLVKAFQSPQVKKFVEEKYQGSVLPAF